MPRKIEFVQRDFTRPNRYTFREKGDFWYSYHFMPNPVGTGLRRAPLWSDHVPFPAGFTDCRIIFYDALTGRVVFIGTKNSHLASTYFTYSTGTMAAAATEFDTGTATPGGIPGNDFVWWQSYLYYFRSNKQLYRSLNYTGTPDALHTNQDGRAITVVSERPIMADTSGELYMLNRSATLMHMWYAATGYLVRFMLPMDGQLMIFVQRTDGGLQIIRMPTDPAYSKYISDAIAADPALIDTVIPDPSHLVTIPGTANFSNDGCLFAQHQGDIYFTTGRALGKTFIYRFNGSRVELADEIPYTDLTSQADGLLSWQDQLFFYSIDTGRTILRVWMGDGFTFLSDVTFTLGSGMDATVAEAGPTVVVTDNPGGTEGVYYLTSNYNPNAKLYTCHIDLGHPARLKRLNRIVINFNLIGFGTATCRTRYALDQSTSFTTIKDYAVCGAPHIIEPTSQITFYTIQLELVFGDSAAFPEVVSNVVPEAISILATMED